MCVCTYEYMYVLLVRSSFYERRQPLNKAREKIMALEEFNENFLPRISPVSRSTSGITGSICGINFPSLFSFSLRNLLFLGFYVRPPQQDCQLYFANIFNVVDELSSQVCATTYQICDQEGGGGLC